MGRQDRYSIVVPVLNEKKVLNEFYKRLTAVMDKLAENYEIIFVNDGSIDNSLEIMKKMSTNDGRVKIIDFSRNFGHQMAITAGIDYASGEAVVTIDVDLQDPPEVIPELIKKWKEGYDVIYAVRQKRKGESFFKKATASLFYRLFNRMAGTSMPLDAGDFRLMDRKVVDNLKQIREKNRYIRGLTIWVGFKQIGVSYERKERFAGHTGYTLKKLLRFAFDAFFSFTISPLKIATYLGLFVVGLSFFYIIYLVILKFSAHTVVEVWNFLVVAIILLGGVQLICLGVLGEYVGRVGEEVRKRPLYIVRRIFDEYKK